MSKQYETAEPMTQRRALAIALIHISDAASQAVQSHGRKDIIARELAEVQAVIRVMLRESSSPGAKAKAL